MNQIKSLILISVAYASSMLSTTAMTDDAWQYNRLLGWVYAEHFPWIANEDGWNYMFAEDATNWNEVWGYHLYFGWYWSVGSNDDPWIFADAVGGDSFLSHAQFMKAVRGEPIPVRDALTYPATVEGDPFEITAISVEQGQLRVTVNYSGGCTDHSFVLVLEDGVKERIPPEAHFHLIHNARGDTCESLLEEDLTFDIASYLQKWSHQGYPEMNIVINPRSSFGSGEVLIDLP